MKKYGIKKIQNNGFMIIPNNKNNNYLSKNWDFNYYFVRPT
jgi:hypothetical protein